MPPGQAARLRDALAELGRPTRLTAPRAVLHEATLVAIDQLAEELSGHCTRLLRERGGPTRELRAGVAELNGLIDVLDAIGYSGGR